MAKLFSIPNFSYYSITKAGDIFDSVGKCVYSNGDPFPMLYDDSNILHEFRREDAISAYCGYLPNTDVGYISPWSFASADLWYKIKKVKRIDEKTLSINGNIFKEISVNHAYYISEYGVIYSVQKDCIIKQNTSKKYRIANLYDDKLKKTRSFYVHHLVYEAYIGERPKDRSKVIDHIDNHPWNNYYKNLQLITYKENTMKDAQAIADSYNSSIDKHLFNMHGSYSYTNDVIEKICELMMDGWSSSEISKYFGIEDEKSRSRMMTLCYRLRNHLTRPEISSKYDFSNYDTVYSKIRSNNHDGNITSKDMEAVVCRMYDREFNQSQICGLTNLDKRVVRNITSRSTRVNNIYSSDETKSFNDPIKNAVSYFIDEGKSVVDITSILKIPDKTVKYYSELIDKSEKGSTTIEKAS